MSKKVVVHRTLDSFFKKTENKRDISVSSGSDNENAKKQKTISTTPVSAKKDQKPYSSNKPPSFLSLETVINDPKSQIFKDNSCICIKDKYPKIDQYCLKSSCFELKKKSTFFKRT